MDIIDFANIPCTSGALKYRRFNKLAAEKELLAYPIARIIVSCINNNYITKRYALAVARSSYEHIKDLKSTVILKELVADFCISIIFYDMMNVSMHFTDYIRCAHILHDTKWKFLNRTVKQGTLIISRDDLARLMEEVVRQKVESGLPHEVPKDIQVALEPYIAEVREIINTSGGKQGFSREGFSEVIPDCFPPCISTAIADVQKNMNLSHTMRFAMTSFLLNIGMASDKVTEIFKASPDFKEQATSYQISHINGASGTTYTCPAYATMATNGNCHGKALCKKVENLLVFYRRKVWVENKKRVVQKQV
jgi:DNA primase large subunit